MTATDLKGEDLFPIELAPDLLWMGSCLEVPYRGTMLHSYTSSYMVSGSESSLLIDPGITGDPHMLERQLETALEGRPPLRWIFLSHQETPHAGGVGRMLDMYPEVTAIGDVRDYHLFFPEHADRFRSMAEGESVDLGDNEFTVVEAVIRDLITTRWGFASRQAALFASDGFAYAHHHRAGQCGKVAEEVPELDIIELAGVFYQYALPWVRLTDMEPYAERLIALIESLGADIVAPVHGLPVTDVRNNLPKTCEGLRQAMNVA
ncbi:MAG: MBL fold metallo-hydrolase [Solirubrobacterales bacterium]|nr:MBL fold metallo-hydrolase [Solirubrobacterales bacterium]